MRSIVELDISNNHIDYLDKYDIERCMSLSLLSLSNNPVVAELHNEPEQDAVVFFNLPAEIMTGMFCKSLAYFRKSFVYQLIRETCDSRLQMPSQFEENSEENNLEDLEDDSFLHVIDNHVRLTQNGQNPLGSPQKDNTQKVQNLEQRSIISPLKKFPENITIHPQPKNHGHISIKGSVISEPYFLEDRRKPQLDTSNRREFILTGENDSVLLCHNSEDVKITRAAWAQLDKFMQIYGILFPGDPYPESKRVVFDSAVSNFANKVVDLIARTETDGKKLHEKDAENQVLAKELQLARKKIKMFESRLVESSSPKLLQETNKSLRQPSSQKPRLNIGLNGHKRSRTREIFMLDEDTIAIDSTSNYKPEESGGSERDLNNQLTENSFATSGVELRRFGSMQYQTNVLKSSDTRKKYVVHDNQSLISLMKEKFWRKPERL